MKKTIYLIPMLALLASCGTKGTGELATKRAERDSLKTVYDKVGKDLKKVEDWLALNDSTANRSLPLVSAKALEQGSFTHYIDVHGVVKADESAALFPLAGGRVASIRSGTRNVSITAARKSASSCSRTSDTGLRNSASTASASPVSGALAWRRRYAP